MLTIILAAPAVLLGALSTVLLRRVAAVPDLLARGIRGGSRSRLRSAMVSLVVARGHSSGPRRTK